jgi:DNA polymerase-1
MRHITFAQSDTYPIALLIKNTAFNQHEIQNAYVEPLLKKGLDLGDIVALDLKYNASNKAPVKLIKEYLEELLPALDSIGVQTIYCADANYFKQLTKEKKAEPHLGYVLKCGIEGYEHMDVVLGVNHKSLLYDPGNEPKLVMSVETLANKVIGNYKAPGQNIIHYEHYPQSDSAIQTAINGLHIYDELTCDIETFSLLFNEAGVGTVAFAWDQHSGISFAVDYVELPERNEDGHYGHQVNNRDVKRMLREFFETYRGTIIWHNCPFDTKVFIYELWMNDLLDTAGLLQGLHTLHQRIHDTKIIAYLATNTTAGNRLGLKELAHEFAGNYAEDEIKDIRKIPLAQLLHYNLVDGLCTWFVYNKYYPIMVADQQEEIYHDLMMPSQKVITQTELTGMPLDPAAVADARLQLEVILDTHSQTLVSKRIIKKLEDRLTTEAWEKDYRDRWDKAKKPENINPKDKATFPRVTFNPNSNPQLQKLLYEEMDLPVIDKTDSKQPATGGDTLEKLQHHTKNQDYLDIIEALNGYSKAAKIMSSFIPAFERAIDKGDGVVYLHGSFNLGGTKSGRLSSSDPNLQNIPAGSTYGTLIKGCFKAPDGYLFVGADFNSLEDYISALTTKDPNKLGVYLDGYDGHCLRAYSYFPERLPGIINTVDSINSIKTHFPKIRQLSKTPTFALTYSGTYITLMKNLGFDKATAKKIEKAYHELYQVSDQWVKTKLDQASNDGYITAAFGLRLRTPLLAKTYRGKSSTPYEAEAEGRTAGNALGQSYGLLNNRALNEFMTRVWGSRYKYDIKPIAMIHDSIYLLIKDDIDVVDWVNQTLINAMQWQELPELKHDKVKLGAELDIHYQNWSQPVTIPNNASLSVIRDHCKKGKQKYEKKMQEVRAA